MAKFLMSTHDHSNSFVKECVLNLWVLVYVLVRHHPPGGKQKMRWGRGNLERRVMVSTCCPPNCPLISIWPCFALRAGSCSVGRGSHAWSGLCGWRRGSRLCGDESRVPGRGTGKICSVPPSPLPTDLSNCRRLQERSLPASTGTLPSLSF